MEADGKPEQLQTNDAEPRLSFCPSFNSYSSDQCAQIAADVAEERPRAASDDFEFTFEKAEEISHDACEFRQIFPVFNRDILFGENRGHPKDDEKRDLSTLLLPLKKLFDEDGSSSCSSSEVDDLERVPEGTYCVWRPKSVKLASPSLDADVETRCQKSNSTGSASKRWKLRDLLLLRRSNSDGKGSSFVFLTPKSTATDVKETEDSKERRNSGEAGKGKAKGAGGGGEKAVSAHEVFYVRNRASKEVDKRKSYLPYRKDLVGFFASVNGGGAGKAFPPF
ncbi:hypothetical protein RHGRI_028224 [Rhododendron griersonianum]|uniref:Uncharacterized protein n=1 Tax=Rhododendron griersonianum TaxID=479676 RepID=A0AAV6IIG7_9ERIC|nr:hypothetical protein RHGRI_028224 [Rhododendron griersonianum]